MKPLLLVLLLAGQICADRVVAASAGHFYRYIDNRGVTVISSRIPSRYVPRGYDVITRDGYLVQRVPPEPDPAEKAQMRKEREEQARLQAWDKELLRRYSHPDDIESARQRKLSQFRNDLKIIAHRIVKITDTINRYQALAAADERAGRPVSGETLATIETLKRDRVIEQQNRRQKQEEQRRSMERFDRDLERLKIIRPNTANR